MGFDRGTQFERSNILHHNQVSAICSVHGDLDRSIRSTRIYGAVRG